MVLPACVKCSHVCIVPRWTSTSPGFRCTTSPRLCDLWRLPFYDYDHIKDFSETETHDADNLTLRFGIQ